MKKSVIYDLRRKCQVAAYRLTNAEFMSKVYFRIVLHKKLNLKNPKSFNEKLQWLKLNYWPKNEDVIQCADKYRVREYLEDKGFGEYLNDLYYVWDSADEINWDELPEQFVLKCNHGCGYNIICPDKNKLDIEDAKNKLNKWMNEKFGYYNAEPHYDKIKPQIICEKFLGSDIVNYNLYCCNGKVRFFSVIQGLGTGEDEALTYYYADNTRAEFYSEAYPISDKELPKSIEKMKELAEKVAVNFPLVRVDFYEVGDDIFFSELTFTPGGALIPFTPPECDEKLGDYLDISYLQK